MPMAEAKLACPVAALPEISSLHIVASNRALKQEQSAKKARGNDQYISRGAGWARDTMKG